jgi:hypothetical protein
MNSNRLLKISSVPKTTYSKSSLAQTISPIIRIIESLFETWETKLPGDFGIFNIPPKGSNEFKNTSSEKSGMNLMIGHPTTYHQKMDYLYVVDNIILIVLEEN